jgi:hypothetical protein
MRENIKKFVKIIFPALFIGCIATGVFYLPLFFIFNICKIEIDVQFLIISFVYCISTSYSVFHITLFYITIPETEKEKKRLLQELEYEKKRNNYFSRFLEEDKQTYPWLAEQIADLSLIADSCRHDNLIYKPRPAIKAAETVAAIAKEKRELIEQNKKMEYQLNYYETVFPWLEDFKEIPPKKAYEYVQDTKKDTSDEYESLRQWLSPDEYKKLPNVEKYQLALDRYLKKEKNIWEVGRDFERFVGYQYEINGFRVTYEGATKHLEDMGRDLIVQVDKHEFLVIQCKRWAKEKIIHEKHIFQLFGTLTLLRVQNPQHIYKGLFICTCDISDLAKKCAKELDIEVKTHYLIEDYPLIKCNISQGTGEKIYHLPFDQQYDKVIIDTQRGEMYAFTVKEAEKNGFRRAFRWNENKKS